MNEFEVRDELIAKQKDIRTFDDLMAFLKDVEENYNIGYGEAPRAMAQASLAVAFYLSDKFGISGFQAGCVMWDFITHWSYKGNKCGLKIVDYDNMLYPQYKDRFEKTIDRNVWESLQNVAHNKIEQAEINHKTIHPDVLDHWKNIVDGIVPFGYKVEGI